MEELAGIKDIVYQKKVEKGWSGEEKYYLETSAGERLLVRAADIQQEEQKREEFEIMKQFYGLGIPMSRPIAVSADPYNGKFYTVLSWLGGEDARSLLPLLPETDQYILGFESGRYLRQMHSIPVSEDHGDWAAYFSQKSDRRIEIYMQCGIHIKEEEVLLRCVQQKQHLLEGRPFCLQHGDYHVGNMIITGERKLGIIDFNRWDYGDPWEEFNRIIWSALISPHFATGQLKGYFGGDPPEEFFELMCYYLASNMFGSVSWAVSYGNGELDGMLKQAELLVDWYEGMTTSVPSWYLKDFYVQYTDGVPYKLKKPFDFSFLKEYGRVFKVFDDQDSGNICFGLEKNEEKYFIKYAGAPTEQYSGDIRKSVERLRETVPVYEDLQHPNLIRMLEVREWERGLALVFRWEEGVCPGRMYPLSRKKFMELGNEVKRQVFDEILSFFLYIAEKKYVAVDFYDSSFLYDVNTGRTMICDIDFFRKQPYVNEEGRMWGSDKFMSPEEYKKGALIDEVTNVYTLGAVAFSLFANLSRDRADWPFSDISYEVVKKAVSEERTQRQQSIQEFADEWRSL